MRLLWNAINLFGFFTQDSALPFHASMKKNAVEFNIIFVCFSIISSEYLLVKSNFHTVMFPESYLCSHFVKFSRTFL